MKHTALQGSRRLPLGTRDAGGLAVIPQLKERQRSCDILSRWVADVTERLASIRYALVLAVMRRVFLPVLLNQGGVSEHEDNQYTSRHIWDREVLKDDCSSVFDSELPDW